MWHLARHAGLTVQQAVAMAAVYFAVPLVFNVNLFESRKLVASCLSRGGFGGSKNRMVLFKHYSLSWDGSFIPDGGGNGHLAACV